MVMLLRWEIEMLWGYTRVRMRQKADLRCCGEAGVTVLENLTGPAVEKDVSGLDGSLKSLDWMVFNMAIWAIIIPRITVGHNA
jgi:hypothetical protein